MQERHPNILAGKFEKSATLFLDPEAPYPKATKYQGLAVCWVCLLPLY